jgi:glycosyltransferase involved in cell wall biosynthesis
VVGDGPLKAELQGLAAQLGVANVVRFEGFRPDVRQYLQLADALVLTSDTEGLPLSILEAMACSLPCIVTDVGGNAEAIVHQQCGLVVPRRSPAEVAQAIECLRYDPVKRRRYGSAARRRVEEEFDQERTLRQLCDRILGTEGSYGNARAQ